MDIKNCFRLKLSDHIWVPTGRVLEWLPKLQSKMKLKYIRVVPELEILTIFPDLTLNFVTLIGRPQCNGRYCWQASLFHLPPKFTSTVKKCGNGNGVRELYSCPRYSYLGPSGHIVNKLTEYYAHHFLKLFEPYSIQHGFRITLQSNPRVSQYKT